MHKEIYVIYNSLSKKNKFRIIKVFFLGLLSNFLELVAIITLFPFILLLLNKEINFQNKYLNYLFFNLGYEKLFTTISFVIIIIFILKNIYLFYFQRYKLRSIFNLYSDLKISLLEAYLKKDFFFFKKKNPSEIINNIRGEAPQLALNVINSSLDIVIDIFLILFIYSFLIILNPTAILSITLLLLLFLFCIKFFFTKKLNYLGKERLKNDIQQTILINESIYGIRDLILYNFEKNLLKVFKKKISQTIIPQYKSLLISASPKLILETLSISFLLIFIILFGVSNITINQIGFLSITFYAFIKLVPNVLSIVRNYQSITFYYPSAKKIINLIKEKNQVRQYKNISNYHKDFFIENIYLKNVTFKYLNHTVIKKVNLEINKKDKILIIGKSGSGKSTLLDILSGLIVPDSGHVLVNNELLNKKNLQKYRNKLSYASQENFIFSGNILNNFKFSVSKGEYFHDYIRGNYPFKKI